MDNTRQIVNGSPPTLCLFLHFLNRSWLRSFRLAWGLGGNISRMIKKRARFWVSLLSSFILLSPSYK